MVETQVSSAEWMYLTPWRGRLRGDSCTGCRKGEEGEETETTYRTEQRHLTPPQLMESLDIKQMKFW
ncbi:hypothetical protein NQZ68_026709, partial [Dissostichus eleginoides]